MTIRRPPLMIDIFGLFLVIISPNRTDENNYIVEK